MVSDSVNSQSGEYEDVSIESDSGQLIIRSFSFSLEGRGLVYMKSGPDGVLQRTRFSPTQLQGTAAKHSGFRSETRIQPKFFNK
jgi:hypothetical protein